MKQLFFLFLFSAAMATIHAQKLSNTQATQVNTLISTANKSIAQANATQDGIIKRLLADSAAKTKKLADQSKLLTDQASAIKRLQADSAAKTKSIVGLGSQLGQVNTRMSITEGVNRSDSILIASLQLQIDATSDAVVKAYLEASRKDSIAGMPGQIEVTPFKGGFTWSLSPDLLQRILNLEAKLPMK